MGKKTVTLRADVYRALTKAKEDDESDSDVVERLLESEAREHPLYGLVGTLDESDAERVRERTASFRESVDEGLNR